MSSWANIRRHVASRYKVAQESKGLIMMLFEVPGGRSQMVVLKHMVLMEGKEEWVQIESPFGPLEDVPLVPLLREIEDTVCGGVGAVGDHVTFRHAVPLENLDLNEFERPLKLVTTTADMLEHKLVGGDRY